MNTKQISWLLIAVFFTIAIGFSFSIYWRTTAEALWGYRPLGAFIGFWLGMMLLVHRKELNDISWDHPLALSTVSGILLGISFPGDLGIFPLAFLAFIPLLRMEELIYKKSGKLSGWAVFRYSYHAFVIWNILSTYWVANASLGAGIFAVTVNSALMALVMVLFHQTRVTLTRFRLVPFWVYWLMFEYLHFRWDLSWPWLTLGNIWSAAPALAQWYEYTGVLGGSLWILGVNTLLYSALRKYLDKENYREMSIWALVVLILPIIGSLIIYYLPEERGESIEVVAIQPNYEPHYQKDNFSKQQQAEHLISLAESAITAQTDYVIFPEVTLGYFQWQDFDNYPEVQVLRNFMDKHPNVALVGGFGIFEDISTEPIQEPAIRQRKSNGQTIYYEVYNAAVQLKENDKSLYKKSKLVPGPEFFPFAKYLGFLKPLVQSFGGTTASLGTERTSKVFSKGALKIAPVICYESIYGQYVATFSKRGAQAIFIMTNDGWWDNTAGHRQHAAIASLRAIETRRPAVRAASTGISSFINKKGRITQKTQYDQAVALKGTIETSKQQTFYMTWGDMIGRLSLFMSLLLLLNTFVKGRLKKN